MKKLIFLLMGFLCSANGFSQGDSLQIMRKLNQLEQVTNATKILIQKSEKIEKQKQTLMDKLRIYIFNLKYQNKLNEKRATSEQAKNQAAKKADNINHPVSEIEIPVQPVPDGVDTVRGSFFYRIFHAENFILRPYKIVNDEKIYLD